MIITVAATRVWCMLAIDFSYVITVYVICYVTEKDGKFIYIHH